MKKRRVEVDFNEYDRVSGEIPIPRVSMAALERAGVASRDGLQLQLYSPDLDDDGEPADLVVDGEIRLDAETNLWIARVNPMTFRHVASRTRVQAPGRR